MGISFPPLAIFLMKKILQIALLELKILFFSPVAWVLMIIFMIQCGVSIMDLLQAKETGQQLDANLRSLTVDVFSGNRGFFYSVLKYTYLYIPLLTMGVFSRELSSGSIKLLQSSPLSNFQVVIGKYIALLLFGLYFVLVLLGIAITASLLIDNLDWGIIIAGVTGIYVLLASYAAIGLFMSSLTAYQVVAAISTLAIFAGLNFVGEIGKGNEVLREITYWLSLQGRTDDFINGMISSHNLLYFILVIVLFLGITIMRLDDGRVLRSDLQRTWRYVVWIAGLLFLGFISSLPSVRSYWDLSRFQANTLTENSKEVIANLDQDIHFKNYVNILHPHGRLGTPKWRKFDIKQFEQYVRYIPGLKMEYIYYYDYTPIYADSTINLLEKAQRAALAHEVPFEEVLSPEEIKKQIDLGPEYNTYVRYVHHGKDSVVLRMFMDSEGYPKESEISSALKRLYSKVPLIGFLEGHDERSVVKVGDKAYNKLTTDIQARYALVNNGFDVINLKVDELDSLAERLTVLVIADPYIPFSESEKEIVQKYIAQGGNLLLAAEPGKESILNELLLDLPVYFDDKQIYQKYKDVELDVVQAVASEEAIGLGLIKGSSQVVSLVGTTSINVRPEMNGYLQAPILVSQVPQVWREDIGLDVRSDSSIISKSDQTSYVLATALTKDVKEGESQKILLLGDADFMSNSELARYNIRTVNGDFTINLFKWFADNRFPVETKRPESIDNKIMVTSDILKTIRYTWIGLFPIVIGLIGATLLIRRKRR